MSKLMTEQIQSELVDIVLRGDKPSSKLLEAYGVDVRVAERIMELLRTHLDYLLGYRPLSTYFDFMSTPNRWFAEHGPKGREYQQVLVIWDGWLYERGTGKVQATIFMTREGNFVGKVVLRDTYHVSPALSLREAAKWLRAEATELGLEVGSPALHIAHGLCRVLDLTNDDRETRLRRQRTTAEQMRSILSRTPTPTL